MKLFFEEYGGMVLAIAGTLLILGIYSRSLLQADGAFVQMILFWGNGGC